MKNLVRFFQDDSGRVEFFRPDYVTHLSAGSRQGSTYISFLGDNNEVEVRGTPEEVALALGFTVELFDGGHEDSETEDEEDEEDDDFWGTGDDTEEEEEDDNEDLSDEEDEE